MRLAGVNIPDNKRLEIALTYIYGIGRPSALAILQKTKIENKRVKDLKSEEVAKLRTEIENFKVEGELRQFIRQNINRFKSIKSYRGTRHLKKLPVRGQRTKTNSRTIRGNIRRTAGSGKRKLTKT